MGGAVVVSLLDTRSSLCECFFFFLTVIDRWLNCQKAAAAAESVRGSLEE